MTSPDQPRTPAPPGVRHEYGCPGCGCYVDNDPALPPDQMTALERRLTEEQTENARHRDNAAWAAEHANALADRLAAVIDERNAFRAQLDQLRAELQQANAVVAGLTAELAEAQSRIEFLASGDAVKGAIWERDQAIARADHSRAVVEAARKGITSARSALGGGPCEEVEQACQGCAVEMRDATGYLDDALAALDAVRAPEGEQSQTSVTNMVVIADPQTPT